MRKNLTIVFLSLILLIPTVSHAARDYGNSSRIDAFFGEVYLGINSGVLFIDDVPDSDGANIQNIGFTFGKGINSVLAMEFTYNVTVTEDDTDLGDLSGDNIGLYLVAKTPGTVYFKGRFGYTRTTLERDFRGDSFDHNSYGLAYGIGGGVKIVKGGAIELEYTLLPEVEDSGIMGSSEDGTSTYLSIAYVLGFE